MLLALLLGAGPCDAPCTRNASSTPRAAAAPGSDSEPITEQVSSHAARVRALATRVARLAPEWDDVVREYDRAAAAHEAAQRALRESDGLYAASSEQHLQAARVAARAATEWKLAQALIVVAAAMDAARLDAARAGRRLDLGELSCAEGMSPRAYRAHLAEAGVSLIGKDICHIVPTSIGGANHPANYVLCDSQLNRSLGNAFSRGICEGYAGAAGCARAIAVSRECGTLRGLGF